MKLALVNLENIQAINVAEESTGTSIVPESRLQLNDPDFGHISCSLITTPNVSLMHGSINLNQAIMLKTKAPLNSLNVTFMLEGNIESDFYQYSDKVQLYSNSHNINYLEDAEGDHLLIQGNIKPFHLNISSEYFMQNFASDDVITEKLKNSIIKNIPQLASSNPAYITPDMKKIMHSILNCPYKGGLKKMFIEIKALELITMQFSQFADQNNTYNILSQKEIEIAFHVKSLIEEDFLHNWTLDELAKKTASNIQTLKKSFKALFHTSIFDYYQQLRMDFARELILNQNFTVAETSEYLGYSHQNHFSSAFSKKFGYPPSELKKNSLKPMLIKSI
jgi:AraC-like DNA-binding protein